MRKRFETVAGIWLPMDGVEYLESYKKAKRHPMVLRWIIRLGTMSIVPSAGKKYQNIQLISMRVILTGRDGYASIAMTNT